MRDSFAVLELPVDASEAEAKAAYRRFAKRWHPDANPGDPNAAARFQALSDAYAQALRAVRARSAESGAAGFGGGFGAGQAKPGFGRAGGAHWAFGTGDGGEGAGLSDPYLVLGVGRDASAADVEAAYRRQIGPLRAAAESGNVLAQRGLRGVEAAYALLSDPARRAEYDEANASAAPAWAQEALRRASSEPEGRMSAQLAGFDAPESEWWISSIAVIAPILAGVFAGAYPLWLLSLPAAEQAAAVAAMEPLARFVAAIAPMVDLTYQDVLTHEAGTPERAAAARASLAAMWIGGWLPAFLFLFAPVRRLYADFICGFLDGEHGSWAPLGLIAVIGGLGFYVYESSINLAIYRARAGWTYHMALDDVAIHGRALLQCLPFLCVGVLAGLWEMRRGAA